MGYGAAPGAPVGPDTGTDRKMNNPALAKGFIFYPKVGYVVTGSGDENTDDSYSGATTNTPSPSSTSGDDKSGFALGADFLAGVTSTLRIGGGLLWLPSLKAKVGDTELTGGNQLNLAAIIEPVIPASETVAIAIRGQGGLSLLIPGGDLSDAINQKKSECSQDLAAGDPKCDVNGGPGLGWHLGGGGGVIVGVGGRTRLRFDLLAQYMNQSTWSYSHTHAASGGSGSYTHDVSYGISGTRLFLIAGIEI